ncbi:P-loop containing nucleoside triphosphate hydrolase protein [Gorgonomyces haynaldii]|nr:P-loop containing nucleoside triphosphate hydrolase protein [Gorgonomyces haynaldii]
MPFFLEQTIAFFNGKETIFKSGYYYGLVLFALQAMIALSTATETSIKRRISQIMGSVLVSAVFEKNFKMDPKARTQFTEGQMLNLTGLDTRRITNIVVEFNTIWYIPVSVTISVIYLWQYLGYSMFSVLALVLSLLAVNFGCVGLQTRAMAEYIKKNDTRVDRTREYLNGIHIIKFFGIESKMVNRIFEARVQQIKALTSFFIYGMIPVGYGIMSPYFMPVVAFAIYSTYGTLKLETVFAALYLFEQIRYPITQIEFAFKVIINYRLSFKRMNDFLTASESETVESKADGLVFEKTRFEYPDGSFKIDLDLQIPSKAHVGIVGKVGSGKTSIFSAIVGDMIRTEGKMYKGGSIAYCTQKPWIHSGTLRDNITFGLELDEKKLKTVIEKCSMSVDISKMPNGLDTVIGEKGLNLSGGQKARLGLARAAYSDHDIYLLDDPLAALDAQVGQQVYQNLIQDYLKHKTVLLITHQTHLLKDMDTILQVEDGQVQEVAFESIASGFSVETQQQEELSDVNQSTKQLIVAEDRRKGVVKAAIFKEYLQLIGPFYLTIYFSGFFLLLGSSIASPLWLAQWAQSNQETSKNLGIYAGIGVLSCTALIMLFYSMQFGPLHASNQMHNKAVARVFSSTIGFFESQPIGRIVNRLSEDIDACDTQFYYILLNFTLSLNAVVTSMVLITISNPYLLVQVALIVMVLIRMHQVYQPSNREIKRLTSIEKSPLVSLISEAFTGASTIKAYSRQHAFIQRQRHLLDMSQSSSFLFLSLKAWLNLRLGLLSATLCLGVVFLAIVNPTPQIGVVIGAALTYSSQITEQLGALVRLSADAEAEMNSIERLSYYMNDIPQERQDPDEPKDWPSDGKIVFKSVSLQYPSSDHLALDDVNVTVQPGEKLGVIGRTGSGKSTLANCLFRPIELKQGTILIDGQDISTVSLPYLRSRMQLIPQDPVLFKGTIRFNIDVEEQYDDAQIWSALESVGLKSFISEMEDKLDAQVKQGGDNFSAGQKQLLCLARAILKQPKVLVMDEATASVDSESDQLIQRAIENLFENTTVISIAHRLHTIAGFDTILVMDQGRVKEHASPKQLLENPDSLYTQNNVPSVIN